MARKDYRSDEITVSFDPGRCIHSKECIHGLPEVFDIEQRPWIQPDNSATATVAEVVMRCPTGALQFVRKDGGAEEPTPEENVVAVAADGPLYVRGDVEIRDSLGNTVLEDTRVALCRCGESQNKPFCDNSHKQSGFRHEGSIGKSPYEEDDANDGRLTVVLTPNGPLFLKGGFELKDSRGETGYRGEKAALCRCGHSGGKPFCDGSHAAEGWQDD